MANKYELHLFMSPYLIPATKVQHLEESFHDMVGVFKMLALLNQLTSWQTKFKFKLNFPTTFALATSKRSFSDSQT